MHSGPGSSADPRTVMGTWALARVVRPLIRADRPPRRIHQRGDRPAEAVRARHQGTPSVVAGRTPLPGEVFRGRAALPLVDRKDYRFAGRGMAAPCGARSAWATANDSAGECSAETGSRLGLIDAHQTDATLTYHLPPSRRPSRPQRHEVTPAQRQRPGTAQPGSRSAA